jgi:hypothetical protein
VTVARRAGGTDAATIPMQARVIAAPAAGSLPPAATPHTASSCVRTGLGSFVCALTAIRQAEIA